MKNNNHDSIAEESSGVRFSTPDGWISSGIVCEDERKYNVNVTEMFRNAVEAVLRSKGNLLDYMSHKDEFIKEVSKHIPPGYYLHSASFNGNILEGWVRPSYYSNEKEEERRNSELKKLTDSIAESYKGKFIDDLTVKSLVDEANEILIPEGYTLDNIDTNNYTRIYAKVAPYIVGVDVPALCNSILTEKFKIIKELVAEMYANETFQFGMTKESVEEYVKHIEERLLHPYSLTDIEYDEKTHTLKATVVQEIKRISINIDAKKEGEINEE